MLAPTTLTRRAPLLLESTTPIVPTPLTTNTAGIPKTDTASRASGLIAYTTITNTGPKVTVMQSDGTKQAAIRPGLEPAWSPDGRRITYATVEEVRSDIAIANVDGSAARRLTNDLYPDVQPSWSPDGGQIAFVSTRDNNADIYTIDVARGSVRRLTSELGADLHPVWSPDGTRIGFTSTRGTGAGIYVMRADGSNPRRLTTSALDWGPAWSPDATKIAFASSRGGLSEIYVMNADGGGQHRVTNVAGADDPSWSPDARRIVFSRLLDIYVIELTSGATTKLTASLRNTDPAWQPGPSLVAARRPQAVEVRVLSATGTRSAPPSATLGASQSAQRPRSPSPTEPRVRPRVASTSSTTDRGRDDEHTRSSISSSLRKPSDLPFDARSVAASAAGVALLLLLVFPANLFSNTFEEHYDEIMGWLGRRRRTSRNRMPSSGRRWFAVAVMGAVTAVLSGFLDPNFGPDRASVVLVLSVVGVFVLLTLLRLGQIAYLNRGAPGRAQLRPFPGALTIAALTVGISRALAFQPGYLLGNVTGTASKDPLTTRQKGRAQALGLAAILGSSFIAWWVWSLLTDAAAAPNPSLTALVFDTFLAACFVGGIGSALFALMPIRWLEGYDVLRYSRWLWIGLTVPTAFAFVHVLLQPSQGTAGAVVLPLILFCVFGVASVAFWAYFRYRLAPPPARPAARRRPAVHTPVTPSRPPGRAATRARSDTPRRRAARGSSSRA